MAEFGLKKTLTTMTELVNGNVQCAIEDGEDGQEKNYKKVSKKKDMENNSMETLIQLIDTEIQRRAIQDGIHPDEWMEHMDKYAEQIINEIKKAYE
jgi:hypothetical protein